MTKNDQSKKGITSGAIVIILVGVLLFLIPSILIPFHTKGEPREALVALSMLQHDNYILAYTNGTDIAYKPPFFHWCIVFFSSLLNGGLVNEWTSRMPSVFFSIVMGVFMFRALTKRFKEIDARLALLTILVCFTTVEWSRAAWACRVDMVNSALMVINIFLLHGLCIASRIQPARRTCFEVILLSLSLAAGFLTKGPVSIVLPVGICGLILLLGYYAMPKVLIKRLALLIIPALIGSALALCWYAAAMQQGGDRFYDLVMDENVRRFLGKMTYSSHNEPFYYNLITLVAGVLPYTVLLIASLFTVQWKRIRKFSSQKTSVSSCLGRISKRCRCADDINPLALVSLILILVFYTIPSSKRSVYLLPMYPFISFYVAKLIVFLCDKHRKYIKGYSRFLTVVAALLLLTPPLIHFGIIPENIFGGKHVAENKLILQTIGQMSWSYWLLVLLILLGFFYTVFRKTYLSVVLITGTIMTGVYSCILPQVLSLKSDKVVAEDLSKLIGKDALLYEYRAEFEPKNRLHYFTVNFYLGGRMTPFGESDMEHQVKQQSSGFVLMPTDDADKFMLHYPKTFLHKVKDFNRRSCDDRKDMVLYRFSQIQ